jgi:hypothetical protein
MQVKVMKKCLRGKQAFGVCALGNHIYVVGGFAGGPVSTCERYDILLDKWELLPEAELPFQAFAISLVVVEKRYIVGLGLMQKVGLQS